MKIRLLPWIYLSLASSLGDNDSYNGWTIAIDKAGNTYNDTSYQNY